VRVFLTLVLSVLFSSEPAVFFRGLSLPFLCFLSAGRYSISRERERKKERLRGADFFYFIAVLTRFEKIVNSLSRTRINNSECLQNKYAYIYGCFFRINKVVCHFSPFFSE